MTSLFRVLCRSFCTTTSATSVSSRSSTKLDAIVNDVFKERNLASLVNKFKKSSESYRFRCKHRVYENTIRRLASAKRFSDIEEILEDQKKYNDIEKEGFAIRLISLYGKSGMFDKASQTFDQLPELKCQRTVKSFNALLSACVDTKNFDKVEPLFRELPSSLSVEPDVYSYNIMLRSYCEMGSLDSALTFLDEMEKNGVTPNLVTFNTLLNAFYEDNRFSDGEKIWVRMENSNCVPDIRSFNAKLRGLVLAGKISELVTLVKELETKGPKPDIHSFNALIKGHCNVGDLEAAKLIYGELDEKDLVPNRSTFQALVPCLCEKGDFDLALKFCKESLNRRCFLDVGLLQTVVDGLVKESKLDEAKEFVELAKVRCYGKSSLKLPSDGE